MALLFEFNSAKVRSNIFSSSEYHCLNDDSLLLYVLSFIRNCEEKSIWIALLSSLVGYRFT